MIAVIKRQCLGGVSAAAIAAASLFCLPHTASASCEAVYSEDAGHVSVSCDGVDEGTPTAPDAAFATSFESTVTGSEPTIPFIYDGNGADVLVFTGGQIVQGDGITGNDPPYSPEVTDGAGGTIFVDAYLDERAGTIETLGGDDTFQLGEPPAVPGVEPITIGAAGAYIDVLLGSGADTFIMSTGTIYGNVFGQGGSEAAGSVVGNNFTISGGTIDGVIFAGSQNDSIEISGTTVITGRGAAPDAIGLEDGDDIFVMTGGTIGAAVSGGNGIDQLRVEGGTIQSFLAGNAGNDTITVLGGVIVGGVQGNEGADQITMSGGSTGVVTGDEDDDTISFSGTAQAESLQGAAGADTVSVQGGTVTAGVSGGDGNDSLSAAGGTVSGGLSGNAGNDAISVSGAAAVSGGANGGDGDDTITVSGGTVNDGVNGDAGADTLQISGGTVNQGVNGGADNDAVSVSGGTVNGGVSGGTGSDAITISGGAVNQNVAGGDGVDQLSVEGGTIQGFLAGNAGTDTITVLGGVIVGGVQGNEGADHITMSGGSTGVVTGDEDDDTISFSGTAQAESLQGAAGADTISVQGGTVSAGVSGGDGNDSLSAAGGTVNGGLSGNAGNDAIAVSGAAAVSGGANGGDGDDTITVSGGTVNDGVNGDAGADTLQISGGTINQGVNGGADNDAVTVSGGMVNGGVSGGTGSDAITISGGTVNQNVAGGDGVDTVEMRGGTVSGGIEAETVHLFGGTIGGDISGLTGNTLVIDDAEWPEALVLRDGVLFSGTNAVGTIEDSDLGSGGMSQNFSGFSSLSLTNSTLRFEGGTQTIDNLFLAGGSTLFVDGVATLAAQNGGFGNLSIAGSTINLIDGDPTDRLILGGIVLNGGTIAIDVDQTAGLADLLVANGASSASGNNVVLVNLVGALELTGTTEIGILTTNGTDLGGVFTVEGITGTAASLFEYEVVAGANGGLVLRATPIGGLIGLASSLDAAASAAALETSIQALDGINDDAIEHALGLAGRMGAASNATFGVFASGQFARVEHDGFSVSDGVSTFAGPSFDSNDFSAAISVDFNAAKHWGFDAEYGLNLGVFAGFTSTDLSMDAYGGFASVGSADNESGMGGVYALMRREQNYLLLSATGFWGETHAVNGVLGAEGEYGTQGYAVTASAGRIFALGEKTRFDLRGGLLGASFTGDAYTDSRGVQHGESEISFGAIKFEPGIYAEYALENGMIFSPYARADVQLRFGYENTAAAEGRTFEFDDEDLSAALGTGFNLRMNQSTTLSGELRGKASSDSTTLAAKLGLKVAF